MPNVGVNAFCCFLLVCLLVFILRCYKNLLKYTCTEGIFNKEDSSNQRYTEDKTYNKKIQFFKQGPAYKKEGPDPNKGSNQQ